jgi:hypothetical protein
VEEGTVAEEESCCTAEVVVGLGIAGAGCGSSDQGKTWRRASTSGERRVGGMSDVYLTQYVLVSRLPDVDVLAA